MKLRKLGVVHKSLIKVEKKDPAVGKKQTNKKKLLSIISRPSEFSTFVSVMTTSVWLCNKFEHFSETEKHEARKQIIKL